MTMYKSLSRAVAATLAGAAISLSGTATADSTQVTLDSVLVASNLSFPVGVFSAPGDYTRLYIIQKGGTIRVFNKKSGAISNFLSLTVSGGGTVNSEQGLLGMAFHPDYQENGYFFVFLTNTSGNTEVRRYTAITPTMASPGTAIIVKRTTQPFANHNGGWIEFGPNDGYLYIGLGDGGSAGDPGNRAQNLGNPLGKIWRIDIDNDDFPGDPFKNYAIPGDNPFVGVSGALDEIWAYGLRNPWRCAFDPVTGDLYIGDVGQNAREEINFQPGTSTGGENYGWKCREGSATYSPPSCPADPSILVDPVYEYTHGTGQCITGGRVYRGNRIPGFEGAYIGADYISNFTFSWRINETSPGNFGISEFVNRSAQIQPSGSGQLTRMASFGEDQWGNLYIARQHSSTVSQVYRLGEAGNTQIKWSDVNNDGVVDFADLLSVLAAWGPCVGCPEDIDGNDVVDFNDILFLLADWD